MSEKAIQAEILLKLGSDPSIRVFKNIVGQAYCGKVAALTHDQVILKRYYRVVYGLTPGSADLIGWHSYTVKPEDVGRTVAIFTSVEVKNPTKSVTSGAQMNWLTQVRKHGGIALIARSPDEALNGVIGWRPQ